MKRIFIQFLLSLLASSHAYSQWIPIPFPASSRNEFLTSYNWVDSHFIAGVSNNSSIYYSEDAGNSFLQIQIPVTHPGTFQQVSVNEAYLIDYGKNLILHTKTLWSSIDTLIISDGNDTAFNNNRVIFLHFWDEKSGLLLGDSSDGCLEAWQTQDGGGSWNHISCQNLPAQKLNILLSLNFLPQLSELGNGRGILRFPQYPSVHFFISSFGNEIKKTTVPIEFRITSQMAFQDSLHGLALRKYSFNTGITSILSTSDGGKTWDSSLFYTQFLNNIIHAPASTLHQGAYVASGNGTFNSRDAGKTWEQWDTIYRESLNFFDIEHGFSIVADNGNGIGGYLFDPAVLPYPNSVAQTIENQFSLYPNPCKNYITIENSGQETRVTLIGVDGKTHGHWTLHQGTNKLRLNVPAGIYFIRDAEGAFCEKVVVVD